MDCLLLLPVLDCSFILDSCLGMFCASMKLILNVLMKE